MHFSTLAKTFYRTCLQGLISKKLGHSNFFISSIAKWPSFLKFTPRAELVKLSPCLYLLWAVQAGGIKMKRTSHLVLLISLLYIQSSPIGGNTVGYNLTPKFGSIEYENASVKVGSNVNLNFAAGVNPINLRFSFFLDCGNTVFWNPNYIPLPHPNRPVLHTVFKNLPKLLQKTHGQFQKKLVFWKKINLISHLFSAVVLFHVDYLCLLLSFSLTFLFCLLIPYYILWL